MSLDDAIHEVAEGLCALSFWYSFKGEENHLDYYYAEAGLYVIRNSDTVSYAFVKADSPEEALQIYKRIALLSGDKSPCDDCQEFVCDGCEWAEREEE
jgi:hypothetical protein